MKEVAKILAEGRGGGARLLRATVATWGTGGHVIWCQGAALSGLPVLSSAGTLAKGDVVAVLRAGKSYLILGKMTTP